jgi:DNA polymerase-3 subunit epsilon
VAFNPIIHLMKEAYGRFNSSILSGLQGQQNAQNIAFVRQLQREMRKEQPMSERLDQLKVVVFDIETTGFYPDKGDAILSIGAIKIDGGLIDEENVFYSLIFYENSLSEDIAELTGITNEELLAAPPLTQVLLQFFEFAEDALLVAHHANHEKAFLQHASWKQFRTPFKHRILDTSFLFQIADPNLTITRLEDYCTHNGIQVIDRHHALGDARLTAKLWSLYLKKVKQLGIVTIGDLYEALSKVR